MKKIIRQPCAAWGEKLAARHAADLSEMERAALQKHVQECEACASAFAAYAFMEKALRALPPVEPLRHLSIEGGEFAGSKQGAALSAGPEEQTHSEATRAPTPLLPRHIRMRPHARLLRAVSLVAVLLIILSFLIGTSVLLLNRSRTAGTVQPTLPVPPMTLSRCADQPMPVLVDLCIRHQFKDILQWGRIGKYIFVLERAYLDMNQLVIEYRVLSQSSGQQTFTDAVISVTSQGQTFEEVAGNGGETGPRASLFSLPLVPKNTQPLQIHAIVSAIHPLPGAPGSSPPPIEHGLITFDFTLAYHGGLVVTPHQTITANGFSITLERVAISPSETIIDGTTKGSFSGSSDIDFSLDAAGRRSSPAFLAFGGDSQPFNVIFYDALSGQHGTWTLQISEPNTSESWVFHFRVP
ncbi:MAG: hypothetical protein M3Y81_10660 [Chloroflexota bacterium]|nr:hypothetical protein [Chloroflexota bacterium]